MKLAFLHSARLKGITSCCSFLEICRRSCLNLSVHFRKPDRRTYRGTNSSAGLRAGKLK